MASFAIVGKPSKGGIAIYLRIIERRVVRRLSLQVTVARSYWNESAAEVRKSHRNYKEINQTLKRAVSTAEDLYYAERAEGYMPSADRIKELTAIALDLVKKPEPVEEGGDVVAYMKMLADEDDRRGAPATADVRRRDANKLHAFAGEKVVAWRMLTPAFLERFHTHLLEKGNKQNTANGALRSIRAALKKAQKRGDAPAEVRPFDMVTIRSEKTRKAILTLGELHKLEAYHEGLAAGPRRDAVASFLLSVYLLGMRIGDLLTLDAGDVRPLDGGGYMVTYRMTKTGTPKDIPLRGRAARLLGEYTGGRGYVMPQLRGQEKLKGRELHEAIKRETSAINRLLHKSEEPAGLKKHITCHVARYSFANIAREMGFTEAEVQQAMAHLDRATTAGYLGEIESRDLDARVARLFE